MSKRGADKYLTDQNWQEEDEPEEAGEFSQASDEVLKKRTFKTAKRRIGPAGSETSAFKGFSGLTSKPAGTSSNGFKGFNLSSMTGTKPMFTLQTKADSTSSKLEEAKEKVTEEKTDSLSTASKPKETSSETPNSEYNRHLGALNRSVSKWISDHVAKNPLCDLSPIFKDYHKHLSDIEDKYGGSASQSDTSQNSTTDEKETSPKPSSPSPLKTQFEAPKPKTPPKNPLGDAFKATSGSSFTGFPTFGSQVSTSGFSGFQFSSKMVGSSSQPASQGDSQASTEEEYVPPVPQASIVQEEDAFYTKKCKLFYMKEGAYVDKGVGHLHLKPVPSTKKTQMIVRADTSLGNLLLNIMLNSAMPVSKQGKNNVVISCVPNPPVDEKNPEKVVPMLIRVKTSEDADELVELLNKKKEEEE